MLTPTKILCGVGPSGRGRGTGIGGSPAISGLLRGRGTTWSIWDKSLSSFWVEAGLAMASSGVCNALAGINGTTWIIGDQRSAKPQPMSTVLSVSVKACSRTAIKLDVGSAPTSGSRWPPRNHNRLEQPAKSAMTAMPYLNARIERGPQTNRTDTVHRLLSVRHLIWRCAAWLIEMMVQDEHARRRWKIAVSGGAVDVFNELRDCRLPLRRDCFDFHPERIFQTDARLVTVDGDGTLNDRWLHRGVPLPLRRRLPELIPWRYCGRAELTRGFGDPTRVHNVKVEPSLFSRCRLRSRASFAQTRR